MVPRSKIRFLPIVAGCALAMSVSTPVVAADNSMKPIKSECNIIQTSDPMVTLRKTQSAKWNCGKMASGAYRVYVNIAPTEVDNKLVRVVYELSLVNRRDKKSINVPIIPDGRVDINIPPNPNCCSHVILVDGASVDLAGGDVYFKLQIDGVYNNYDEKHDDAGSISIPKNIVLKLKRE